MSSVAMVNREIPKAKVSSRTKGCESCAQLSSRATNDKQTLSRNHADEERLQHIEEQRLREHERRQQVEDRKRALEAADQQRRAQLLQKSLERDLKAMEKRRECNSTAFAFGSSTPRLINAGDASAMATPTITPIRRRAASFSNAEANKSSRNNSTAPKPKQRANSISAGDDIAQNKLSSSLLVTPLKKTSMSRSMSKTVTATSTPTTETKLTNSSSKLRALQKPQNLMSTSLIKTASTVTPLKPSTNMMSTSLIQTKSTANSTLKKLNNNLMSNSFTKSCASSPLRTPTTNSMSKSMIVASNNTKSKPQCNKTVMNSTAASSKIPKAITTATATSPTAVKSVTSTAESKKQFTRNNPLMTASFMARNKITTEEQAIAALAEQRRIKREEAERQAAAQELELAQRNFAAEIEREQAENERQRKFVEESVRLVEAHQRATAENLRQAIQAAKLGSTNTTTNTQSRRCGSMNECRAQKDAEIMRKLEEAAERLRLEEIERKERRKRVEEIMSRMRKGSTSGCGGGSCGTGSGSDDSNEEIKPRNVPQQQKNATSDLSSHGKYNVNSTGILIVRESNFNFLRS